MDLIKGSLYHGFRLEEEEKIDEISSLARRFYHEKSGARLLYLQNDDDNKVFSVTFRTPPEDSTGVAHIVEHSVLCGSRKFPMKEPFVELVKGSLNTYLNAMTFPDKTMYPVASRNVKDFRNLMDVYLDAVFYPNIYNSLETLMQEGWHYELENPVDEITYKGVVYNEMKGVFSSPDAILEKKNFESLFPDTAYGVESGGDPEFIPELTQEKFIDFHKKYYHPSNGYIFLYGDLDILDNLKFLDEAYLSNFEKIDVNSQIALQPAFKEKVENVFEYSIAPSENIEDKTFLSRNFVLGKATNSEICLAFQILEYLLLETPAAPLRNALIEAEIGKDVVGTFVKSILQPTFGIVITGANENEKAKFIQVVDEELERLVREGIDKELIEACINIFEFTLREANYGTRPKGLVYNIKCMDSWLYDASPFIHLGYEDDLVKIKAALKTNYFEQLIEQHLLNNNHQALVILKPKHGLAEEKDEELRKYLAEYKASLSDIEINELVEQTQRLKTLQETADSPEALATIPLLTRQDIEVKSEELIVVEKQELGVPVLLHPLRTNAIAYVNMYFDTCLVPQQYLPYMYLLSEILGKVSTKQYEYSALSNEINKNTGGIVFDVAVFTENANDSKYLPKFIIKGKSLVEKLPQLLRLTEQIIAHSRFDNSKRMKELIQEIKSNWDMNLFRRGQQLATNRVLSYFSPIAQYNEVGMLAFYDFVAALEKDFASKSEEVYKNLETVAGFIFNKENLLVSVTVEEENYSEFQKAFSEFHSCLASTTEKPAVYHFENSHYNEGLMTSGKVQYVVKGANFRKLGYSYHGSLKVLETILRYDYLWTRVRVQGGAYGGFARLERNGNMVLGSYRDPNLKETLTVYDETANYLRNFSVDQREMTKYVIGTMSQLDTPLTPSQKGERATNNYIRNISQAMIQQERDEILATGQEDISKLADLMEDAMKQNHLCVLGNEQKIKDNSNLFQHVTNILK
ncbi:insulinase family protein [Pelosinus fermentans]|uniref:Peptidase M16C associated domain protein n=1 Tax=Pelosinus fermentans JBW45 TaxID=1192197 RepID=I8U1D1_9FIRM|nr:insulinase family protein [Pelosinus fermentans]AJQ28075.1 Peptidase M16C associated domain protein [Pelosinus fermentans JBW45]